MLRASRTIFSSALTTRTINKRWISIPKRKLKLNNKQNSNNSNTNTNSKDKNEGTVSQHAWKTLLTYLIPLSVFGLYSLFNSDTNNNKDASNRYSNKESFTSLLTRMIKGEKVWEDLKPRTELIRVTRLNDKFNNYSYCIEKQESEPLAELHMRHIEAIAKLRKRVCFI